MALITNTSRATRVISVKDGGSVVPLSIEPGDTVEADPVETDVLRLSGEAGLLRIEGAAKVKDGK